MLKSTKITRRVLEHDRLGQYIHWYVCLNYDIKVPDTIDQTSHRIHLRTKIVVTVTCQGDQM